MWLNWEYRKYTLLTFLSLQTPLSCYVRTIVKKCKRCRKVEVDDNKFLRWEKDYELIPVSIHGLFFEYLELGKKERILTIIIIIIL